MKCLKEQSKHTEKYKKARKYCTERLTRAKCDERRRVQLASLNFTKSLPLADIWRKGHVMSSLKVTAVTFYPMHILVKIQ